MHHHLRHRGDRAPTHRPGLHQRVIQRLLVAELRVLPTQPASGGTQPAEETGDMAFRAGDGDRAQPLGVGVLPTLDGTSPVGLLLDIIDRAVVLAHPGGSRPVDLPHRAPQATQLDT